MPAAVEISNPDISKIVTPQLSLECHTHLSSYQKLTRVFIRLLITH